jgi:hypothetical protein
MFRPFFRSRRSRRSRPRATARQALSLGAAALLVWGAFGPERPGAVAAGMPEKPEAETRPGAEPPVSSALRIAVDAITDLPAMDPLVPAVLGAPRDETPSDLWVVRARGGDDACAISVRAEPQLGATVSVSVDAPCHGASRLDFVQAGLTVTVRLDRSGGAAVELPALSDAPVIGVVVSGAEPVMLQTWAADFDRYHRAVLHWSGAAAPELHAFESGAGWGEAGHVGPAAPGSAEAALEGRGGYLIDLGDASVEGGHRALVYTAPRGVPAALSVEAPVTAESCGKPLAAGTIRVGPGLAEATSRLSLTMPGCDALGEFVALGAVIAPIEAD